MALSGTVYSNNLALAAGGRLFGQVAPPAPTLATTISGSFSAGAHVVQLVYVGWDGGTTALGPSASIITSGSQGIQVTWTPPSGFQGVQIYIDTQLQQVYSHHPLNLLVVSFSAEGRPSSMVRDCPIWTIPRLSLRL